MKMSSKKIPKREPNKKNVKTVEELTKLVEENRTTLLASIKDLPASQFQEISKKLRGKAMVKVPKKNLIFMALDSSGKEAIKELKEKIGDSIAILFSKLDAFELAGELLTNKTSTKAKPGQEAPEDIEVQAGPTDLVPGPAISELGALGIQIQIEKGKISIKEPKVIVKKNEKISKEAAELMGKLGIKPFSTGFIPLCAFDNKEGKFYSELKIDKEGTLQELKVAYQKALSLMVEIEYLTPESVVFMIKKANAQINKLNKAIKGEPEVVQETPNQIEHPKEKKEETKETAGEGLASLFG